MTLTVSFVRAVRADPRPQRLLAILAGWPHFQQLVPILSQRVINNTPKQRARVAKLAQIVGYDGAIFAEARRG